MRSFFSLNVYLKKNLNVSKPSEHPPERGRNRQDDDELRAFSADVL